MNKTHTLRGLLAAILCAAPALTQAATIYFTTTTNSTIWTADSSGAPAPMAL